MRASLGHRPPSVGAYAALLLAVLSVIGSAALVFSGGLIGVNTKRAIEGEIKRLRSSLNGLTSVSCYGERKEERLDYFRGPTTDSTVWTYLPSRIC